MGLPVGSTDAPQAGASAPDVVFSCEGVTKTFGHGAAAKTILRDVTIHVREGEFLTIVGGSGVGKTTFLKMLGGLIPCSSGSVKLDGRPIDGPPDGVITVFQDYSRSLLPWRTAEQNVSFGLEAAGVPRTERAARVAQALENVGLSHAAGQRPWQLSGGMQQRLQIARALAVEPTVLLMDEPFGSLDAITKAALQDELLRLHGETGKTIVFITHDVEEAVYLGDRTVVLNGRPAGITASFDVDLPRPRDQIVTRESERFLELRHELHGAMRKDGA